MAYTNSQELEIGNTHSNLYTTLYNTYEKQYASKPAKK